MILLALLACQGPEPVDSAASPAVTLDAPRLLRRMSLDLRGTLPTESEITRVRKDPEQLDTLRQEYLDSPLLEDRLVELLAERWHTRVDDFKVAWYDFPGLEADDEFTFERSLGEEPLRLMARTVVEDRSWAEVVTSDHTVANDLLVELFELEELSTEGIWRRARYPDQRPPAGVLATNGFLVKYYTTPFNMNRSRVNATARLLVCDELLSRPVSFSTAPSLEDGGGTDEALRTNPSCTACHSVIEPVAVLFFGFHTVDDNAVAELGYHPEREPLGPVALGVEGAWYGQPVADLEQLGQAIAADERLSSCAVETWAEALWRRPVRPQDQQELVRLDRLLREEDLRVRPLLEELTRTEAYALAPEDPDEPSRRLQSPDQLSTSIRYLTGFTWSEGGWDRLRQDADGYRVLAGGVDGFDQLRQQGDPGLTWSLVTHRLAEGAAAYEVGHNLGQDGALLSRVTLASRPGDAEFAEQLEALIWRLFARAPQPEELEALEALWAELEEERGAEEAWVLVLSLLLRDVEFLSR